MKLFAQALIASVAAGKSRRSTCSDTPNEALPITGAAGQWVELGNGDWKLTCPDGSQHMSARAKCRQGAWENIGAAHCFEVPEIPEFLEAAEIMGNTKFKCQIAEGNSSTKREPKIKGWKNNGKYVFELYRESLKYLEGYAKALTESDGICRFSDNTMIQTNTHTYGGPEYMCIMDRRDMQLLVKHIYFILAHPLKAMRCFHPRHDVGWMYGVGAENWTNTSEAGFSQWARDQGRVNLDEFYEDEGQVPNAEVREFGKIYAENFGKMVTGPDVYAPDAFPFDITANGLPTLWGGAGWVPMYAWDSERNKKNFIKTRGSYAYAEVLGHWGLIRLSEINGEKVGAEIGMVAQGIDTFYPFHNHAIPEIYYTIREPACAEEFLNFAIRENNPLLETVSETDSMREVEFDGSDEHAHKFWVPTSPKVDDLIYFHSNTIHAFKIDGANCHAAPEEKAIVTVWARSMAHDTRNDYGTTLLCESAANPETPALETEEWRCDLTKTKWRRSAEQKVLDPRFCPYCQ